MPEREEDKGVERVQANGTTLGHVIGMRGASVTSMVMGPAGFDALHGLTQILQDKSRSSWFRAQDSGWSAV